MSQFFLFQAGPVQEFIAQARSTRDLWSGSYLISWLMAHALRKVIDLGGEVVFPVTGKQPLLEFLRSKPGNHKGNPAEILTPNLPNRFLAEVPDEFHATEIESAFRDEWTLISEECWNWLQIKHPFNLKTARELWTSQVERHWQLTWQLWPAHSWKDVRAIWEKTPLALDPKRPPLLGSDSDKAWVADYEVVCHRSIPGGSSATSRHGRASKNPSQWISRLYGALCSRMPFPGKRMRLAGGGAIRPRRIGSIRCAKIKISNSIFVQRNLLER